MFCTAPAWIEGSGRTREFSIAVTPLRSAPEDGALPLFIGVNAFRPSAEAAVCRPISVFALLLMTTTRYECSPTRPARLRT